MRRVPKKGSLLKHPRKSCISEVIPSGAIDHTEGAPGSDRAAASSCLAVRTTDIARAERLWDAPFARSGSREQGI